MARSIRCTLAVAASTLALASSAPVAAQETHGDTLLTVARYMDYEMVLDPRISPDGTQIAYTRRWVNTMADRWESALWLMNADGSRNRFFAKGAAAGASARWSPDGKRIAYLAEGEPQGTQLFVRWVDGAAESSQISHLAEAPADIRWSPDGRWIGFSMFVPTPATWKIDMPTPRSGAKWTEAPRIVERLHFRQDRHGFSEPGNTHLFVVSADGGTPRQLTSGDWSVGARFDALSGSVGWDWTPDGRTIVADGFKESSYDLNYRDSHLYAIDVMSGATRRITPEAGTWHSPVVSPDGRSIAFVGYPRSTASYHAAELYSIGLDGTGLKKLSGDLDRDAQELQWSADGSTIYFTAGDRGAQNIHAAARTGGGGARPLTTGAQMLSLGSVARSGMAAVVRATASSPPDVVRIDLKRPADMTPLTHVNDALLSRTKLGKVEEVWYPSTGGTRVQGWIVKPPGFDPSRKYPLILEIHGGPHGMYNSAFNYSFQNFAANGFVVLYVNPRGSTGYGSAFGNAIEHAYPGVDYDDLMAGVDTVVRRGYVDEKSMFVGGCSGGGVLSSWVIGHTHRFAAAAVRCPVINWLSMAGQTDIPLFTYNFFEKPFWEDPKKWLEQSSIMYVGNVTTPTLVMTGELDRRTPIAQSEEYYAALKMRGVPSVLLRFADEYHGTGSKPSNFMRTQLYMMSWYRKYLGQGGDTRAASK